MVTGIDLVKEQIRIAAGTPMTLRQRDITLNGAAIECRVYAEDPENNFFPSPGTIRFLKTPSGPGVRDDSGVYEGWNVPIDYDPLISKLVAWAPTRTEAIDRMQRALLEYQIEGIQTNLAFFREVLDHQTSGRANSIPDSLSAGFGNARLVNLLRDRADRHLSPPGRRLQA
jgi:acetyl-CoA carboxylase biotin carboxylase subunit